MDGGEDAGLLAPSLISHYNFCHSPNEIFLSRIFSTCLSNILSCEMENSEFSGWSMCALHSVHRSDVLPAPVG